MDLGYLLVVQGYGSEIAPRVVFFAAFLGVMSALSLAGASVARRDEDVAQALLYVATTGYLLAGVIGLASIGLFLIVAGLLAFIAAGARHVPLRVVAAVVASTASALVMGVVLT